MAKHEQEEREQLEALTADVVALVNQEIERRGCTRTWVANVAGVQRSDLYNLLNGKTRSWRVHKLAAVAAAVGIKLEITLNGEQV